MIELLPVTGLSYKMKKGQHGMTGSRHNHNESREASEDNRGISVDSVDRRTYRQQWYLENNHKVLRAECTRGGMIDMEVRA